MTRYHGNQEVNPGFYLDLARFRFVSLLEAGRLPGAAADVYRKVPVLLMLVTAPLLGLLYVIFLPVIGFVMAGSALLHKAGQTAEAGLGRVAHVLRPSWHPLAAYLHRGEAAKGGPGEPDRWAEDTKERLARNEPRQ